MTDFLCDGLHAMNGVLSLQYKQHQYYYTIMEARPQTNVRNFVKHNHEISRECLRSEKKE